MPNWLWVLIGVIIILVYLVSAGHIKLVKDKDGEPFEGRNDGKSKETPSTKIVNEANSLVKSNQESVGAQNEVTELIEDRGPKEKKEKADEQTDSLGSSPKDNINTIKEQIDLFQSELNDCRRLERRISRWVNLSFILVRVIFASVFVSYNLFIIHWQDLPYSIATIAALAPYNNWAIVFIGVLLFVMFKSPSNLKGMSRNIHSAIVKSFTRKQNGLSGRIETLEEKLTQHKCLLPNESNRA